MRGKHQSKEHRERRYRQGAWTFWEVALSSRPTGLNVTFKHSVFYLSLGEKMSYPERDIRLMIAIVAATRERVRELIRDRELASSHKLEQMRRVRMLKK